MHELGLQVFPGTRLPHLQRQLTITRTAVKPKPTFYRLFPLSCPFFHTLVSLTGKQLESWAPNNYPACVYFALNWKWLQHHRGLILTSGFVLPPPASAIIEDLTPTMPWSCGIYPATLPPFSLGLVRKGNFKNKTAQAAMARRLLLRFAAH